MQIEAVGDKVVIKRSSEELTPFKQRLNRIEGQVRGLKQMIEDHRHCNEAIQQSNAVIAAVREVALMLISQQLQGQATRLEQPDVSAGGTTPKITDFVETLRSSYRFA